MAGKRKRIELFTDKPLQDFHNNLASCNDADATLTLTRETIGSVNCWHREMIHQVIKDAAERLEKIGVAPHTISARLTRDLKGVAKGRTIRDSLEDKYKDPSKRRSPLLIHSQDAPKSEQNEAGFAAPMPQNTTSQRANAPAISVPAIATTIAIISGAVVATWLRQSGSTNQWPPAPLPEEISGYSILPSTLVDGEGFIPKEMQARVNQAFASSTSGCVVRFSGGVAVDVRPDTHAD